MCVFLLHLYIFSGAEALRVEFDRQCSTERKHDPLTIMDGSGKVICTRSGREWSDWSTEVRIAGMVSMCDVKTLKITLQ